MDSELITNWTDHDHSLRKVLLLATRTIRIFDEDLSKLGLERPENASFLRRFLGADIHHTLTIILKNPEPLLRNSPRLMNLLAEFSHGMKVVECAPQLASLNDSMLLADDNHALVRFSNGQARSRVIIENEDECRPYILRFEEILKEGGTPISATILGL